MVSGSTSRKKTAHDARRSAINLIDAIKSEKPYRKVGSSFWIEPGLSQHWSCANIIADNWEIQEATVTITRTQLYAVWEEIIRDNTTMGRLAALAEKLGLKP